MDINAVLCKISFQDDGNIDRITKLISPLLHLVLLETIKHCTEIIRGTKNYYMYLLKQNEFEDTKGIIRIPKSSFSIESTELSGNKHHQCCFETNILIFTVRGQYCITFK